jgi:hypothetical protein
MKYTLLQVISWWSGSVCNSWNKDVVFMLCGLHEMILIVLLWTWN